MLKTMKYVGFTIIELVITITIMGILLTVAIVSTSGAQVNARDAERKSDISAIQANLESYYQQGVQSSTVLYKYPSTELIDSGETSVTAFLVNIDVESLLPPGVTDVSLGFIEATNNNQAEGSVAPQPTVSQYVYQPLQADGSLCTSESQECRKYNLFYQLEGDSTIYKVTSKHQ